METIERSLTIDTLLLQLSTGLATGMVLFIIAAGLTITMGLAGILNFAHGAFYMLGAYFTAQIAGVVMGKVAGSDAGNLFWLAFVIAPIGVAAIGAVIEIFIIRRVYFGQALRQLVIMFGLGLIIADVVKLIWGTRSYHISMPEILKGSIPFLGITYPVYNIFAIGISALVGIGIWCLFERTRLGTILKAMIDDREMVGNLGLSVPFISTMVFVFGMWLAGMGGVLMAPMISINPQMGGTVMLQALVIVVIGGWGNVLGSFIAALLIGIISTLGASYLPQFYVIIPFLLMAVVVLFMPKGIAGKGMEMKG